jgi:Protein of unknown function (DUF3775)
MPSLSISAKKVYWISTNARRFGVKDVVTDPDPGSNPSDDGMREVLEDHVDDPIAAELIADIRALNEDEQIDLVALAWLGRGDGDLNDWDSLRSQAAAAHNDRTALYLLGMPLLSDYLDEALAQFGHSAEEFERPR